jgi:hypothetical protein
MLPNERSGMSGPALPEEELAAFEGLLRAAAPQPSPALRARVGREVQAALRQRSSLTAVRDVTPRRPIRLARIAAIVVAVLLVAGTALAIGAWLRQLIQGDPGLASVFDRGDGIPLSLSQSADGYTVDMQWAYADGNRLTLAFTIAGPAGETFTNLDPAFHISTVTVRSGGEAVPVAFTTARSTAVEEGIAGSVAVYDLAGFTPGGDTLDVHAELYVESVTPAARTAIPSPEAYDDWWTGPYGPFVFDFSLPLSAEQRVLTSALDATDSGITIALDRVVITPSQVRVTLCYADPAADRTWTLIPDLTAGGELVSGGGATDNVPSGIEGRTCSRFTYNAAMFDYRGEWALTVSELVGFGPGGGDDQQRIPGDWRFTFVVPE